MWSTTVTDDDDNDESDMFARSCSYQLLPEKLNRSMNLRQRGHEYTLSHIITTQLKNTFVNRYLFSMV